MSAHIVEPGGSAVNPERQKTAPDRKNSVTHFEPVASDPLKGLAPILSRRFYQLLMRFCTLEVALREAADDREAVDEILAGKQALVDLHRGFVQRGGA